MRPLISRSGWGTPAPHQPVVGQHFGTARVGGGQEQGPAQAPPAASGPSIGAGRAGQQREREDHQQTTETPPYATFSRVSFESATMYCSGGFHLPHRSQGLRGVGVKGGGGIGG